MTGPGQPAGSEPSPSLPRGARLGVAGKTAVLSCMASPLSGPKEGEVRWRGVRYGVAVNFDQRGQHCCHPHPLGGGGGRVTWLQVGWQEPAPWVRGRGLLTTGVSSELTTGVNNELTTGVSSELTTGVSSKLTMGVFCWKQAESYYNT
jgi:hypothetical protein